VKFVLQVNSPGPFEYKGTIYLDDAGFREVEVTVKGPALAKAASGQ
jgi:hypothetical protein